MTKPADQPVLVLGASADIARAVAVDLAKRGHPLMLAGRNTESLERDAADIALRHEVEVTVHHCDVLDTAGHGAFLDGLPTLPAGLICAVGLLGDQDENAAQVTLRDKVIASNFTGPVGLIEEAAARMHAAGAPGWIIGIGSVAGDRGRAKNYVYGAAKAGFAEYLSGMRQKYNGTKLHILTVKPGFVRTAMTEGMDLPGPLTSEPEQMARGILRALDKRLMVYYDLNRLLVMTIIKLVPEKIFARMKF